MVTTAKSKLIQNVYRVTPPDATTTFYTVRIKLSSGLIWPVKCVGPGYVVEEIFIDSGNDINIVPEFYNDARFNNKFEIIDNGKLVWNGKWIT